MEKDKLLQLLGERIKAIRLEKGLTQAELASKIGKGKDQQSLQRLESGRINPSYHYLFELCQGLNITLKELFDFKIPEK